MLRTNESADLSQAELIVQAAATGLKMYQEKKAKEKAKKEKKKALAAERAALERERAYLPTQAALPVTEVPLWPFVVGGAVFVAGVLAILLLRK